MARGLSFVREGGALVYTWPTGDELRLHRAHDGVALRRWVRDSWSGRELCVPADVVPHAALPRLAEEIQKLCGHPVPAGL